MEWAEKQDVIIQHIQPGHSAQNAYIIETIADGSGLGHVMALDLQQRPPKMGIGGITQAQKLKIAS